MKKVALSLLAFVFVGSLAFADVGASVYVTGSVADNDGNGFTLDNRRQKDADLLRFWFNGKNAGAEFKLWTQLSNQNGSDVSGDEGALKDLTALPGTVKIRGANVWFKPIDSVKISLGSVGAYAYTEQLDWWKTPTGSNLNQFNWWSSRWSNSITSNDSNAGIQAEYTGVENLTLTGTYTPTYGAGNPARGGVAVRYNLKDLPVGSMTVAYRDDGKGSAKLARAGFDTANIPNFYGFADVIARLDNFTDAAADPKLEGVSIDTYGKYSADGLSVAFKLPVTMRLTGKDNDASYLTYDVKISYDVPAVKLTPYFRIQQEGFALGKTGNDNDQKILPTVNVGTDINGFEGSFVTVSFQYTVGATKNTWKIPFETRVSF